MQWRHGTRRWILNFAKSHISFWTLSESPLLPSPNRTITQPHLRSMFACSMMERDKVCSHDGNKGKMVWRETHWGPMWLLMWPLLLEKLSNGQSSGRGGNSQVRVAPHSSEAQELKEGSLGTWSCEHPLTCSWLHRETLWGGSTLPSSSKKVWSEKLCLPGSLNIHSQFCFQHSPNGKPRQMCGQPLCPSAGGDASLSLVLFQCPSSIPTSAPLHPTRHGSSTQLFIYLAAVGLGCGTWELSLQCTDSLVVACGLSGSSLLGLCSAAHGILVPGPEIESASPALQGRFLTTGPPGTLQLGKFLRDRD